MSELQLIAANLPGLGDTAEWQNGGISDGGIDTCLQPETGNKQEIKLQWHRN